MEKYTYISKKNGQEVTAYKFEVWLVGNNPQHYCIGFIKGNEKQCNLARRKYTDHTVWSFSKVSLDA